MDCVGWFRLARLQGCTGIPRASLSWIAAAALVMAVLAGCGNLKSDDSNPCPLANYTGGRSAQAGPPKMHIHPNGLQLSVSETCQVGTTPAGFVIEPPDPHNLRYPFSVSIQLLATPPAATGHRLRYLGSGRILWYSATHRESVGSGDPEWELLAFEHVGNHWIEYRENKQDEGQPEELWEIAQGLRYLPSS